MNGSRARFPLRAPGWLPLRFPSIPASATWHLTAAAAGYAQSSLGRAADIRPATGGRPTAIGHGLPLRLLSYCQRSHAASTPRASGSFVRELPLSPHFGQIAALLASYRRFPLSDASYLCILTFLAMHAVGAHYAYAGTPLGFAAAELLGLTRNHYDRLAHFAFGLLFACPTREVLLRTSNLRGVRLAFATVSMLLAASAGYELIEWWVALVVDPHAAYAYLGTQGDVFDAQKDESLALAGSFTGVALRAEWTRLHGRCKPGRCSRGGASPRRNPRC